MNIQSAIKNAPHIAYTAGLNLGKLTETIPNTKVCKNLTQLDRNMLHEYIDAKPYIMGISPKEIDELNKFEGEDFVLKSYDLITKKLGLGKNIRPELYFLEIPGDAKFKYANEINVIYVDPNKLGNINKIEMFGFIRHEIQHFIQNLRILRHEELGPKYIDVIVNKYFGTQKQAMIHLCTQYTEPDIRNIALTQSNSEEFYRNVMNARKCLETNDVNGFDDICRGLTEEYRKEMTEYRNKVVKEFGIIKKDSSLTPKIESDFQELNEVGYYNSDDSINLLKYVKSKIEDEACNAQVAAGFEFSQEPCFIQFFKKQIPRTWEEMNSL